MEDMFRIGVITSTHGLKGEVKVFPTTDDVNRFRQLKDCYIQTKTDMLPVKKNTCKFFKNMVILSFEGINDINEVEKYKGCELYVDRKNAVALEEDEYYIADVIGSKIIDEEGKNIGILDDVMQTGANDVFVIKTDDGREILVPVIEACVLDMDFDNKLVTVRLMKGMLD